jgi:hypothetical protein
LTFTVDSSSHLLKLPVSQDEQYGGLGYWLDAPPGCSWIHIQYFCSNAMPGFHRPMVCLLFTASSRS